MTKIIMKLSILCLNQVIIDIRITINTHSSISLTVAPTVQLTLGRMVNPSDLEEGDDVYFECNVKANPPAYKMTWWHNVSVLINLTNSLIY